MPSPFILDIGGEGRSSDAWNLNPRRTKTFGRDRGQLIPRLIVGRGDRIPLFDASVDLAIVERMPLRVGTVCEIARVAKPTAIIVLRHALPPTGNDPHRAALEGLAGSVERRMAKIGSHSVLETVIRLAHKAR